MNRRLAASVVAVLVLLNGCAPGPAAGPAPGSIGSATPTTGNTSSPTTAFSIPCISATPAAPLKTDVATACDIQAHTILKDGLDPNQVPEPCLPKYQGTEQGCASCHGCNEYWKDTNTWVRAPDGTYKPAPTPNPALVPDPNLQGSTTLAPPSPDAGAAGEEKTTQAAAPRPGCILSGSGYDISIVAYGPEAKEFCQGLIDNPPAGVQMEEVENVTAGDTEICYMNPDDKNQLQVWDDIEHIKGAAICKEFSKHMWVGNPDNTAYTPYYSPAAPPSAI